MKDWYFDVSVLQRTEAYFNGLEDRLGFPVRDNKSLLIHVAGVSMEGRQTLLSKLAQRCSFSSSPSVSLETEPENQYDPSAVKVVAATEYDAVTGCESYSCVGYIPRGRCPYCSLTLSGQKASSEVCSSCHKPIGLSSEVCHLKSINRVIFGLLSDASKKLLVGIDNVTKGPRGSMGLDIWVRVLNIS